jgi:hypothetical protein
MVLQTSGQISMEDIKNEFGDTNPVAINEFYRGGNYVSSGVGDLSINLNIPTAGEISLEDFYGGEGYFVYTISSNTAITSERQIDTLIRAAGWNTTVPLWLRIDPDVYVYTNSNLVSGSPAQLLAAIEFRNTGLNPMNITIENRGFIVGKGGTSTINVNGQNGGPAINCTTSFSAINLNIRNYGWIAGGGGSGSRSTYSISIDGNLDRIIIGGGAGGAGGGDGGELYEYAYRDPAGVSINPPNIRQVGTGGAGGGPGELGSRSESRPVGTKLIVVRQGGGGGGGGGGTLAMFTTATQPPGEDGWTDGFFIGGGGGGRQFPGIYRPDGSLAGDGLFADGGGPQIAGGDGRTGGHLQSNNPYGGGGGGYGAGGGNSYGGGGGGGAALRNTTGGSNSIINSGTIYGGILTS